MARVIRVEDQQYSSCCMLYVFQLWYSPEPDRILVCYYRYLRFYPSGRFLYKNSSQKVKDVVKCMNFRATKADCVLVGSTHLPKIRLKLPFYILVCDQLC